MSFETFKPLRNLILARKIDLDLTTKSGIILLESFSMSELTKDLDKPYIAEILSFGPGIKEKGEQFIDMSCFEVGQTILFGPTAFTKKFKENGETYFILEERHVFGIYSIERGLAT